MARLRALLVEDDGRLAALVTEYLGKNEIDVTHLVDGERLVRTLKGEPFDVLLLDVMLPGLDGLQLCKAVRAEPGLQRTAILMITAKGDDVDRIVGLELGADDYLVKPFGFRELLARIRAVMRRARPGTDRAQIHVGALEIDVRGRRAVMGDDALNLTTKEFDLLALLASEQGDVVSRQRILREVWDTEWFGPTKTVDVHVASLRKKLGDPGWIETVRGVGLRLVARP